MEYDTSSNTPTKKKGISQKAWDSLTPSQKARVHAAEKRRMEAANKRMEEDKAKAEKARAEAASAGNYGSRVDQTAADVNDILGQMEEERRKRRKAAGQ